MPASRPSKTSWAALAGAAIMALAAAAPAVAADGSVFPPNYTFPDGTRGFMLVGHGGFIEPCILIGFGPNSDEHDLPVTTLDLRDPTLPTFINTFEGQHFLLEWDIMDFGDGSVEPPPAPNSDGFTSFRHSLGGHTFESTFGFGPGPVDPGSWVGFNPQPDPPGFVFGVDFDFSAPADPFMHFQMFEDGQVLSFALESVPEPGSWSLMIAGFGLVGAGVRHRRRAAAASA
jgi:hypothetical protein